MDISNDEDGQSKGVIDGNQWGEDKAIAKLINIATTLQNESESTQDDPMQSITRYYVHELRYEHVTLGLHKSSETNMEVRIVYLANHTRKLIIEANLAQEPEAKAEANST